MESLGEAYCNLGITFFESCEYDRAVEYLVKAYNLGHQKETVLEYLYSCFVTPNEEEFQKHYEENCAEMAQFPYERLSLDFFPISEDKYYIFDKEEMEFIGVFEMDEEPVHGKRGTFHSILYTGIWDMRQILPGLKEKDWETVYILLDGLESKFLSFFKLPGFKGLYLQNVVLFSNSGLMGLFFEEYEEFYLPKELVSTEPEKYIRMLRELHKKRICYPQKERRNVFLSICIPSHNRGKLALENVLHILQCPYDSEIEIIVSNNGSVKEAEKYEEIKRLPDCRVRYHEFEKNQGYAANVLKTLGLARGKYAVLASDEDFILLEHMEEYLSYLKVHRAGGIYKENIANLFKERGQVCKLGIDAIENTLLLNYMTGITFNMDVLEKLHCLEAAKNMMGNTFFETYTHIVLATIVGKHADFHSIDLELWGKKYPEREEDGKLVSYAFPKSRIGQLQGIADFLQKLNLANSDFVNLMMKQCDRVYSMLMAAYMAFDGYKDIYSWEDVCMFVYREETKIVEGFSDLLIEEGKEKAKKYLKKIFLDAMSEEEISQRLGADEAQERKQLLQWVRKAEEPLLERYCESRWEQIKRQEVKMDSWDA